MTRKPDPAQKQEERICGRIPYRGDGSLWCERDFGHVGLHEGDGSAFYRTHQDRFIASDHLVVLTVRRHINERLQAERRERRRNRRGR